ncbi:MAG: hypothetical protein ACLP8A_02670 [Methylovirgula sp.]
MSADPRYPPAWEEDLAETGAPCEMCPYSVAEMEEYLRQNHFHWSQGEPVMSFHFVGMVGELASGDRRYWACELTDDLGQKWFVVVGSGRSPSQPDRFTQRWMLAFEEDDCASPQQLLDNVNRDQLEHDARNA